jgi:negative regulator of sigma E activity
MQMGKWAKMQIYKLALLLVAVGAFSSQLTVADAASDPTPTLASVLQRIASAEREVSYVGRRILISWTDDGSLAREELVVHQPPAIHFVKPLTPSGDSPPPISREAGRGRGPMSKDFRSDGPTKRRFKGREFGPHPQQPIELMSPKDIELLSQNYQFQYTASEKIAGYETDLLTIQPRFEGRPTKRLWMAKDKGIILRMEARDAQGNTNFMAVYTQISFRPEQVEQKVNELRLKEEPRHPRPGERPPRGRLGPIEPVPLPAAQEAFNHQLILPAYLPQGFQLQNVTLMKFRPEPTVHLRYTDGLMVVSLFESKGAPPREQQSSGEDVRIEQIHQTSVQIMERRQIRILRWFQGNMNLTLIGELSRPEMLRIAESLLLNAAP